MLKRHAIMQCVRALGLFLALAALIGCGGSDRNNAPAPEPAPKPGPDAGPPLKPGQGGSPDTSSNKNPREPELTLVELYDAEAKLGTQLVAGKDVPTIYWKVKYKFIVDHQPQPNSWYDLYANYVGSSLSSVEGKSGQTLGKQGVLEGKGALYDKPVPATVEFTMSMGASKASSSRGIAKKISCPVTKAGK